VADNSQSSEHSVIADRITRSGDRVGCWYPPAFVVRGGRRIRWLFAVAIWALLLFPGPAIALSGGDLDDANAYAAVILLVDSGRGCTSTRIGSRRLLTAGHCVADLSDGGLRSHYRTGGEILLGIAPIVRGPEDLIAMPVARTRLVPAFSEGLERFVAYKQERIADLQRDFAGSSLDRRIRDLSIRHHFSARFPDVAVIELGADLMDVPALTVDTSPMKAGDAVTLVGYGCDDSDAVRLEVGAALRGETIARRRFGASNVIRVDAVNLYTFARQMRPSAPSLCPGDSGGPVLHRGRVVGVHGTVQGLTPGKGARSNRAVSLHALADWAPLVAPVSAGPRHDSPAAIRRRPVGMDASRPTSRPEARHHSRPLPDEQHG